MNRIVQAWNRSQKPPDSTPIPDVIHVDGVRVQVEEKEEMAIRKRPQTDPIFDNSADSEEAEIVVELPKTDLRSVIRYIKLGSLEQVNVIRTATYNNLKRLQVKRDTTQDVPGVPKGRSQGDIGSLLRWMEKIQPGDEKAISQLVTIDACCCARRA